MKNYARLKLLLWKYLHLRRYHAIISLVQIFLPILVVFVVIKVGHELTTFKPAMEPVTIEESRGVVDLIRRIEYDTFFYTPPGQFASKLMNRTLESIMKITGNYRVKLSAVKSENQLAIRLAKTKGNPVGIVFSGITNRNSGPVENEPLEYKIRDKNRWNTSFLFVEAEREENGPYPEDPYFTTGFAGLQYSLDAAYISWVSSMKRLHQTEKPINFSAFPYPEYTKMSKLQSSIPLIMGILVVITSLIISAPLFADIIAEKESGMKELMKISGVQEWLFWISWFVNLLIVNVVVCTAVTFLLQFNFEGPNSAAINFVQPSVLWTCILLYYIANIFLCFTFCVTFHSTVIAAVSFTLIKIVTAYLAFKVHEWHNSILVHLICITPVGAFIQAFLRISYYEMLGLTVTWRSIFSNEMNAADASLGFVFIMLVFDSFLYLFLTNYISAVNPGKHGFRKSPLYLFKDTPAVDWTISGEDEDKFDRKKGQQEVFFEQAVRNREVSLEISDLRKNFGAVHAVKGVNLMVYKGEIFVLLGHNGAGKSTTLAMITGLTEPTYGTILYKGTIDMLRNIDEFRTSFGACPQEDRLFPYLSVTEHLIFYGMLKGATKIEAEEEAVEYLKITGMSNHENYLVSELSGGMKRKLCLSIALMGKPELLILDEPTAGMDAQSKLKIWDLLLELRKTQTIILTTQHMEEAEYLASRIAIMNHGVIACCGSVPFLKKVFGTGYKLQITKKKILPTAKSKDNSAAFTDLILKIVPQATVEKQSVTEISFTLPLAATNKFAAMFRALDAKKAVLGIEKIAFSCTTMEQVFLKVGGESVYDTKGRPLKPNPQIKIPIKSDLFEDKLEGPALIFQQTVALLNKKFIFTVRNWMIFAFRVVIPTLLMILLIHGTRRFNPVDGPLELSIQTYRDALIIMLMNDNSNDQFMNAFTYYLNEIESLYYDLNEKENPVIVSRDESIIQALLDYSRKNIKSYRRDVLLGADFNLKVNKTSSSKPVMTLMYNKWLRHSLPIAINVYGNVNLRYISLDDSFSIIAVNHPIRQVNVSRVEDKFETHVTPMLTVWFILLAFFTVDLLDYFVILVKVERNNGFKHIQIMSSVSLPLYWLSNLLFDIPFYMLIIFLRILVFKAFDDFGFFDFDYHLFVAIILITLFVISGLLFMYAISFTSDSIHGSYIFFFMALLTGTFLTFTYYSFETATLQGSLSLGFVKTILLNIVKFIILLVPPLNFFLAFYKFLTNWRVNNIVEAYAKHGVGDKDQVNQQREYEYFEFASRRNPNGLMGECIFLIADMVLYAALLYTIERGYIGDFFHSVPKSEQEAVIRSNQYLKYDQDMELERYIGAQLAKSVKSGDPSSDLLLVHKMSKIFKNPFSKHVAAIVDVTFVLQKGECFGVLGVDGAGKSTLFKMLTGQLRPSRGNSWVFHWSLSENKYEYLSKCGYCPENNSFLDELTGKETLTFIALLRGISSEQVQEEIEKWIELLDLEDQGNKLCGNYSGGNKRKLCTALSMIGSPDIVFMDEPTMGVDPITRRKLYNVIAQSKSSGHTILLSSHNIEECETLCDRFSILVRGGMRCIGTAEQLMQKYAEGFALKIQLGDFPPESNPREEKRIIRKAVVDKFKPGPCVLKEETKSTLFFQINQKLSWFDLFQRMEEVKHAHQLLKEYIINESSLDEVFRSIINS